MAPAQDTEPARGAAASSAALLEATRPGNASLAAIGALVGALAGLHPSDLALATIAPFVAAAIVGATGTAAGNLLNDVMDRVLDRVAHPARPIPSGRLSVGTAITASAALFLTSLAAATLFSLQAGLATLGLGALLLLYETRLKSRGLWGNLAVAIAAGALFPLGALIVDGAIVAPLILGAIAALSHLGRELLKDAEDAAADAATRRTFAVRHGPVAAARLAAVPFLAAVVAAPLPVPLAGWPALYLALITPSLLLFLAAASDGQRKPARAQRIAKIAMTLAMPAFLLGALG